MAVPFSNTKLRVPKGFQNILEGLAREVLRNQPENPFEFGAKYFEQLLRVRDETGHDPAVHGARLEDRFYNNDSFKSPSVDANSPQQQEAALKIQTNYRKHDAEQKVAAMKEDEAAEKIQAGFRGFQDRQQFSESKGDNKEEEEEVDIDLNDPDVEKAAVKIQAGFKGFKARQEIKDLKSQASLDVVLAEIHHENETEIDIDLEDPDVEKAAIKIQASFKRHLSKEKKLGEEPKKSVGDKEGTSGGAPKGSQEEEEEVDIDLNDPDVAVAAEKIQAGFKKHMMKKKK